MMGKEKESDRAAWFTTLEVSHVLGVSVRTVERWRAEGKFIPNRSTKGGHSRYSLEQIEKMKEHKNSPFYVENPKQPRKQSKLKIKKKTKTMNEQVEKMIEHKNRAAYVEEREQPRKLGKPKIKKKTKTMKLANTPCTFDLPSHEEFVKYVYDFLEQSNTKPSMFGRMALNDSGSIQRLNGTDPRLSTMLKICEAIEKVKQDQSLQKMLQEMME